jgi:hypothetical protein
MLSSTIHQSAAEVSDGDWNHVTSGGAPLASDRRLITSFERQMVGQAKCFTVAMRDGEGKIAAVACLVLFAMDAVDNGPGWLRKIVGQVRRVFRRFLRFNILFCGLPVPCAKNHLFIAPGSDYGEVLQALHLTMRKIGRSHRARMLMIKEFEETECDWVDRLAEFGYVRAELPPEHLLMGRFDSFDEYRSALKARYRQQVVRSEKKLLQQGLAVRHLQSGAIAEVYTDTLHELYLAVLARSQTKLETYPASFFRDLAVIFGEDAVLTTIYRTADEKIVAFIFALRDSEGAHHNLYCGMDYQFNAEADLYFNAFYGDLDFAFRHGASKVHLGQTSDHFKARLGSTQRNVCGFVRATNGLLNIGFRRIAKHVFPKIEHPEDHDVFKEEAVVAKI